MAHFGYFGPEWEWHMQEILLMVDDWSLISNSNAWIYVTLILENFLLLALYGPIHLTSLAMVWLNDAIINKLWHHTIRGHDVFNNKTTWQQQTLIVNCTVNMRALDQTIFFLQ